MMPGRMNPRQMNQMMKRLGINIKEIDNVKKVTIETADKKYIIDDAEVTIMDAQGQKTYQVVGKAKIVKKEEEIPKEDIDLVVEQTKKSKEEAKKALKETKGDIAEAILKLSN